jgi:hypothetical protein
MGKKDEYGCKKGPFLLPIQEVLKEGELSGEELFKKAKERNPEINSLTNPIPSFTQALHCLLGKNIIHRRYDPELDPRRTSKHRFNYKYDKYSLINTEPIRILQLIKLTISEGDMKSYNELEIIFEKNLNEIYLINGQKWESLFKKVEIRNPSYMELLWFEAEQIINLKIKSNLELEEYMDLEYYYDLIKNEMEDLSKWKLKLLNKHGKKCLYQLKIDNKKITDPEEIYIESLNPKPESICQNYLFTENHLSKEEFLKIMEFKKPRKRGHYEVDNLLYQLISYINLHESDKAKLIDQLSKGLGEQENSNELLFQLVVKTTGDWIIERRLFTY